MYTNALAKRPWETFTDRDSHVEREILIEGLSKSKPKIIHLERERESFEDIVNLYIYTSYNYIYIIYI